MPTVDDLKNELRDIEYRIAFYAPGGAVLAENQAKYAELAEQKALLESRLALLEGDTASPVATEPEAVNQEPDDASLPESRAAQDESASEAETVEEAPIGFGASIQHMHALR